jgi:hypothetical protein
VGVISARPITFSSSTSFPICAFLHWALPLIARLANLVALSAIEGTFVREVSIEPPCPPPTEGAQHWTGCSHSFGAKDTDWEDLCDTGANFWLPLPAQFSPR